MKKRILYIDMAKGFAMITIVMLHLVQSNLEGDSALTINFFNHSFNTRLFFFLSGMVVALRGGGKLLYTERCLQLWDKKNEDIVVTVRNMGRSHHVIYL